MMFLYSMLFCERLNLYVLLIKKRYSARNSQRGITLVETLFAMFIFSLVMHTLTLAVVNYRRVDTAIRDDYTPEWHQFLLLLDHELDRYQLVNTSPQQLTLQDNNKRFQIIQHNNKIYKTPGHHPYLLDVRQWQLSYQQSFLSITLEFNNGQQFSGRILLTE